MTKQIQALELAKTAIQSLNGVGEVIQWKNQWELCHKALVSVDAALNEPTPEQYAMGYAEGFNDACKPKKPWVELTSKEIIDVSSMYYRQMGPVEFVQEIQKLLKEKNCD